MNVTYQPPPAVWNPQTGQYDFPQQQAPVTPPAYQPPSPPPQAPPGYAPPPNAAALGAVAGYPAPPPGAPGYALPTQPAGAKPPDYRGMMKLEECRLNWFFVLQRDEDGKQRTMFLLPKSDVATYQKILHAEQEAIAKKWPGNPPQYYARAVRDGDTWVNPDTQKPIDPICKGHWVISSKGTGRLVQVVDIYGSEITHPRAVVSGDYARASVTFYGSETGNKIGVFCCLNNVMFTRKGAPIGGDGTPQISAEEEFRNDFQQPPPGYVPPAAYSPPAGQAPAQQLGQPPQYGAPTGQPVAGFNAPPQTPQYTPPVAPPPAPPAYQPPAPPANNPPPQPIWNPQTGQWVYPA